MAWYEKLLQDALGNAYRNAGITPEAGFKIGSQVWDGTRFIREGNIGDPEQILKNRPKESDLAQNYLSWDSPYNRNMRAWLERMYNQSVGGADALFASGIDPGSGIGGVQRRIARQKASNDAALAAWQQYQGSQGLGVQAQLAHDQGTEALRGQLNQRQMFNDQRRDAFAGDILGGIVDLGLTAATGGFGAVAGGVSGMLSGETQDAVDSMVDAQGNFIGTLATPDFVPSMLKYEGTFREVPEPTPRLTRKKPPTYSDALNYPEFTKWSNSPMTRSYADSLMSWQGPYAQVRNTPGGTNWNQYMRSWLGNSYK